MLVLEFIHFYVVAYIILDSIILVYILGLKYFLDS